MRQLSNAFTPKKKVRPETTFPEVAVDSFVDILVKDRLSKYEEKNERRIRNVELSATYERRELIDRVDALENQNKELQGNISAIFQHLQKEKKFGGGAHGAIGGGGGGNRPINNNSVHFEDDQPALITRVSRLEDVVDRICEHLNIYDSVGKPDSLVYERIKKIESVLQLMVDMGSPKRDSEYLHGNNVFDSSLQDFDSEFIGYSDDKPQRARTAPSGAQRNQFSSLLDGDEGISRPHSGRSIDGKGGNNKIKKGKAIRRQEVTWLKKEVRDNKAQCNFIQNELVRMKLEALRRIEEISDVKKNQDDKIWELHKSVTKALENGVRGASANKDQLNVSEMKIARFEEILNGMSVIKRLDSSIAEITGKVSEITGTVTEITGTVTEITGTVNEIAGTVGELSSQAVDFQDRFSCLNDSVSVITQQCEEEKGRSNGMKTELETASVTLTALDAKICDREGSIENIEKELEKIKEMLETFSSSSVNNTSGVEENLHAGREGSMLGQFHEEGEKGGGLERESTQDELDPRALLESEIQQLKDCIEHQELQLKVLAKDKAKSKNIIRVWLNDFEQKNGRKPVNADKEAVREMYEVYQRHTTELTDLTDEYGANKDKIKTLEERLANMAVEEESAFAIGPTIEELARIREEQEEELLKRRREEEEESARKREALEQELELLKKSEEEALQRKREELEYELQAKREETLRELHAMRELESQRLQKQREWATVLAEREQKRLEEQAALEEAATKQAAEVALQAEAAAEKERLAKEERELRIKKFRQQAEDLAKAQEEEKRLKKEREEMERRRKIEQEILAKREEEKRRKKEQEEIEKSRKQEEERQAAEAQALAEAAEAEAALRELKRKQQEEEERERLRLIQEKKDLEEREKEERERLEREKEERERMEREKEERERLEKEKEELERKQREELEKLQKEMRETLEKEIDLREKIEKEKEEKRKQLEEKDEFEAKKEEEKQDQQDAKEEKDSSEVKSTAVASDDVKDAMKDIKDAVVDAESSEDKNTGKAENDAVSSKTEVAEDTVASIASVAAVGASEEGGKDSVGKLAKMSKLREDIQKLTTAMKTFTEDKGKTKKVIKAWTKEFEAREKRSPSNTDKEGARQIFVDHKKASTALERAEEKLSKLTEELAALQS